MLKKSLAVAVLAATAVAGGAEARDQIRIVGSSTVFPYTQAVAEAFGNKTRYPAPVVEGTGTGGGMKIFCRGIGVGHPDFTGASRTMKKSEWDDCAANGVTDITEALIGHDGLTIAQSRKAADMDLSKKQIFLALAAEVPRDGEWVANPYQTWNDVDPSLPDRRIRVLGPPPTSGTRDAFVELAMEAGCEEFEEAEALSKDDRKVKCGRMRSDGPFIEAGENDNLIVQRIDEDATAMGIFGYSFLFENRDKLKPVTIEGVAPGEEAIADGSYPISRPLFFYVKNAHRGAIPGFEEFLAEYVSDEAMAPGGYLTDRGLVPLPGKRLEEVQDAVLNAKSMSRYTN